MYTVGSSSSPFEATVQAFAAKAMSNRPNDPSTAFALEKLAFIYMQSGRYTAADTIYDDAFEIVKSNKSSEYEDLASRIRNSSAFVKSYLGKPRDAYKIFEPIKDKFLTGVPWGKSANFIDICNYGANLQYQGYDEAAVDILKGLLEQLDWSSLPKVDLFKVRVNLAQVLSLTGDYENSTNELDAAEKLFLTEGKRSEISSEWLNIYGMNEYRRGASKAAVRYFNEAKRLALRISGENSDEYAEILSNSALAAASAGDYDRSSRDIDAAIGISSLGRGERHARALNVKGYLSNYGAISADPLSAFKEALDIRSKCLGEDHPHYAYVLNNIGSFYYKREDRGLAKTYFDRAYASAKKRLTAAHPIMQIINANRSVARNVEALDGFTVAPQFYAN